MVSTAIRDLLPTLATAVLAELPPLLPFSEGWKGEETREESRSSPSLELLREPFSSSGQGNEGWAFDKSRMTS
ncbi:hypothetical protein EON65_42665 [archaeon]|nr:MAG: hypothetical protein EON65_42665 [archaeon]